MKPPLESINLAYFVPGIVALASSYIALKGTLWGCNVEVQLEGMGDVGEGALFLGFAYLVGYALWGAGDRLFRGRSDRRIFFWAVHYLGSSRPLRDYLLINLYGAGHDRIAEKVALATGVEKDDLKELAKSVIAPERSLACDRPCFSQFKQRVSEPPRELWRRICGTFWVRPPEEGNKLRRFCWDAIYNRANEYHVGRLLSDWSNVKFAKSVSVSCFWSAFWIFGRMVYESKNSGTAVLSSMHTVEVCGFAIAAVSFHFVIAWRLRVFARSFVHGLMPYSPVGV
jgi:hypothetical protein